MKADVKKPRVSSGNGRGVRSRASYESRINRNNARLLLRLMYDCYRHGVEDASKVNDENACRGYVGRMRRSHVFRLVTQGFDISWKEWRMNLVVYSQNLSTGRDMMRRYLLDIDGYGAYYSVALRACMDFYVCGVEDFCEYPVHTDLELFFADRHYSKWKKGFRYDVYRDADDVLDDMQTIVYGRMHADEALAAERGEGYRLAMTNRTYNAFIEAVWRSKYAKRLIGD